MKRNVITRWLLLAVFSMTATSGFADISRPSYHALPRSEWEARQREVALRESLMTPNELRHKVVEAIKKITCGEEIIIILVSCVLSLLGITLCVAFAPQKNLVFICFLILLFASLGVAYLVFTGTTSIASMTDVVSSKSVRESTKIQYDITVDPEPGETYEEYVRRVYKYDNPTYRCESCGGETSYLIGGSHCGKCEKRFREEMDKMK